jgi:hypothetical protein
MKGKEATKQVTRQMLIDTLSQKATRNRYLAHMTRDSAKKQSLNSSALVWELEVERLKRPGWIPSNILVASHFGRGAKFVEGDNQ